MSTTQFNGPIQNLNAAGSTFISQTIYDQTVNPSPIYNWFSAPDASKNFKEARERHSEHTNVWFLNDPRFDSWKDNADQLLWLVGSPGSGKTVLCSSAISNIKQHYEGNDSVVFAFFFFDGRDSQSALQSHENSLRSILVQLSRRHPRVLSLLAELHQEGEQPTCKTLEGLLFAALNFFTKVYILIDAVDECSQRSEFLSWLRVITSSSTGLLHILVTSRPEPDIQHAIGSIGACVIRIVVGGDSVSGDIATYIDDKIHQLHRLNDSQLEEVKSALVKSSGGMFRLAAFQVEELKQCFTVRDLRKQILCLPTNLTAMYDQLLLRMGERNRSYALNVLKWLSFSESPLTFREVAEIGAIDLEDSQYDVEGQFHEDFILGVCSGLVMIHEGRWDHPRQPPLLLTGVQDRSSWCTCPSKNTSFPPKSSSNFKMGEAVAHITIAQTCLAYVLNLAKAYPNLQLLAKAAVFRYNTAKQTYIRDCHNDFPLTTYAVEQCIGHSLNAGGDIVDGLTPLLQRLFTPGSPAYATWAYLHRQLPESSLTCAWNYGLDGIAKWLMKTQTITDTTTEDQFGQLLLCHGNMELVRAILARGTTINAPQQFYARALEVASLRGCSDVLKLLLEQEIDPNYRFPSGSTPLYEASHAVHVDAVKLLLEAGADVHAEGGRYGHALQAAVASLPSRSKEEVVRLLLKSGADVNANGGSYGNALQAAAHRGEREIVNLLLANGANANAVGGRFQTTVRAAAFAEHLDIVKILLEKQMNMGTANHTVLPLILPQQITDLLHSRNKMPKELEYKCPSEVNEIYTAIGSVVEVACIIRHVQFLRALLEGGANVNVEAGPFGSVLQMASKQGQLDVVQILLEHGADVNAADGYYGSPLQIASTEGHLDIVKELIKNGAFVDVEGGQDGTALQRAAYSDRVDIVKLLLENKADLSRVGGRHGTALQAASLRGNLQIMRLLLTTENVDVNTQGGQYGNALQAAALQGGLEAVRLLIQNRADINAVGGEFGTALQAASWGGDWKVVKFLVENGTDVTAIGGSHGSALHAAAVRGASESVRVLIKSEVDIDLLWGDYGSALQAAARWGQVDTIELLLESGANANVDGGKHGTALQAALSSDHNKEWKLKIVRLLLKHGADPNMKSRYAKKESPLYILSYRAQATEQEIMSLLMNYGACF